MRGAELTITLGPLPPANDDYGKDLLKGLKDGLGPQAAKLIVAEATYEVADPTVDSQVLTLKERLYVDRSRALGASDGHLMGRHILPNMLPPLLVQASLTVAAAIIAEASLSFLGLGQRPPAPSCPSPPLPAVLPVTDESVIDAPKPSTL